MTAADTCISHTVLDFSSNEASFIHHEQILINFQIPAESIHDPDFIIYCYKVYLNCNNIYNKYKRAPESFKVKLWDCWLFFFVFFLKNRPPPKKKKIESILTPDGLSDVSDFLYGLYYRAKYNCCLCDDLNNWFRRNHKPHKHLMLDDSVWTMSI